MDLDHPFLGDPSAMGPVRSLAVRRRAQGPALHGGRGRSSVSGAAGAHRRPAPRAFGRRGPQESAHCRSSATLWPPPNTPRTGCRGTTGPPSLQSTPTHLSKPRSRTGLTPAQKLLAPPPARSEPPHPSARRPAIPLAATADLNPYQRLTIIRRPSRRRYRLARFHTVTGRTPLSS